jgi:hypothetical protein
MKEDFVSLDVPEYSCAKLPAYLVFSAEFFPCGLVIPLLSWHVFIGVLS